MCRSPLYLRMGAGNPPVYTRIKFLLFDERRFYDLEKGKPVCALGVANFSCGSGIRYNSCYSHRRLRRIGGKGVGNLYATSAILHLLRLLCFARTERFEIPDGFAGHIR
jgi:hypothetical protein